MNFLPIHDKLNTFDTLHVADDKIKKQQKFHSLGKL
jgi:hypothetical protein